jgi:ketosteroid isomerase-like protein
VVTAVVLGCSAPRERLGDPQAEIGAMLARSAADWNHGDLAGFMGDYANDSLTSYVSSGHVQYGWQPLFDHYQANYFAPGKQRDSLAFDELHVRPLTTDLALATARFALHRGATVTASGPFTLVLQRRGDRWQILHDHTSADPKP